MQKISLILQNAQVAKHKLRWLTFPMKCLKMFHTLNSWRLAIAVGKRVRCDGERRSHVFCAAPLWSLMVTLMIAFARNSEPKHDENQTNSLTVRRTSQGCREKRFWAEYTCLNTTGASIQRSFYTTVSSRSTFHTYTVNVLRYKKIRETLTFISWHVTFLSKADKNIWRMTLRSFLSQIETVPPDWNSLDWMDFSANR